MSIPAERCGHLAPGLMTSSKSHVFSSSQKCWSHGGAWSEKRTSALQCRGGWKPELCSEHGGPGAGSSAGAERSGGGGAGLAGQRPARHPLDERVGSCCLSCGESPGPSLGHWDAQSSSVSGRPGAEPSGERTAASAVTIMCPLVFAPAATPPLSGALLPAVPPTEPGTHLPSADLARWPCSLAQVRAGEPTASWVVPSPGQQPGGRAVTCQCAVGKPVLATVGAHLVFSEFVTKARECNWGTPSILGAGGPWGKGRALGRWFRAPRLDPLPRHRHGPSQGDGGGGRHALPSPVGFLGC